MSEPQNHRVDAGPVEFRFDVSLDVKGIEVIRADSVNVEKSDTPRYLATASGPYIQVYSHVYVSIYGVWHDITRDAPPKNYMKQDEE